MSLPQQRMRAAASALVGYDAALLLVAVYAPALWASFRSDGQAAMTGLIAAAALCALIWRLVMRRTPSVLPNALYLPALAFVALSAIVTLFGASMHAGVLEVSRLLFGALLLMLVTNRALLPASPALPVAIIVGASILVTPFVNIIAEAGRTIEVLGIAPTFSVLDGLTAAAAAMVVLRLLATRKRPDPVRRWVEALLFSTVLNVGVYAIREKLINTYVLKPPNPSWEVFATFFNPNSVAGFLAMIVPLALSLTLGAARLRERAAWVVATLVTAAAIVPTNSKGGILALLVALFVYLVLLAALSRRPRRNVVLVLGVFALIVVVVATTVLAVPSLRKDVMRTLGNQNDSNMFRILTWKGTLAMALAHPWLGIGPGAFKTVYMNYAIGGYTEAAHQNYLQVMAEQGVAGLLLFLWLFGAALFTGWRAMRRPGAARGERLLAVGGLCAIVALMAHSFFDYDWYIGVINLTFWLVAGLLGHLAQGRSVLVPEAEEIAPAKGKAKGKRRRLETAVTLRLPEETGARRLRWPRTPARQWAAFATVGAVLLGFVWMPTGSALAQRALSQGDLAMAYSAAAGKQGNTVFAMLQQEVGLRYYRQATALDPLWANAHERFGAVVPGDEGVREIKLACRLEPQSFQPYLSLGRHYEQSGEVTEAAEAYRESLARSPGNTKALRYLALAYQRLGNQPEALRTYQCLVDQLHTPAAKYAAVSIDIDTNYVYAFYELGRAEQTRYWQEGRPEQAKAALDLLSDAQLLAEDYFRPGPGTGRALDEMFRKLGQPRADRSEELQPLLAKACWRKALLYARLGNEAGLARARRKAYAAASKAGIDVAEEVAREDRGAAK